MGPRRKTKGYQADARSESPKPGTVWPRGPLNDRPALHLAPFWAVDEVQSGEEQRVQAMIS